ncbi:inositol monophosphatase family protein [Actinospica robiniae]|uniref:inositol monophosphatase family protein n=1 Tax=Actinospica robiniae TaxID=304901 RepID=UPI00040C9C33|nr:inositol monophosphatase family protein [Actinospica robiniae]
MPATVARPEDAEILTGTTTAVRQAAERLRERYVPASRPSSLDELMSALHANDEAVLDVLRPALAEIRPGAGWVEEELESGALPAGEWWVVDPAEGNMNHVHGMPEWGVTVTLVRDNEPVLAAVHLPLFAAMYTALAGGGAFRDGEALRVSEKTELGLAVVGTSQASPGSGPETVGTVGDSIAAMLHAAMVVRAGVPASLHMLNVAAGSMDVFWQFAGARADLLPGALLIAEAGGLVTDAHGAPWTTSSDTFLAAAPGVHQQAMSTLSTL